MLEVCGLFFRIATLSGAAVKPVAAHNRATLRGGMIAPGFGRSNVVGIFTLSGNGWVKRSATKKPVSELFLPTQNISKSFQELFPVDRVNNWRSLFELMALIAE
ncbi:hypothetical protein HYPGJ_31170 [Hyphomicrobium sp. GJ21]|nr:hypothetical protein HYPGJ_31170 [Hyphomicrobium sp. GJ21]